MFPRSHTFQRGPREQQWTDHKKQRPEAQPQCVLEGAREIPLVCVVTRESWCASAPLSLQNSHVAHTKVCFTQNLPQSISPNRKALTLSSLCSKALKLLTINCICWKLTNVACSYFWNFDTLEKQPPRLKADMKDALISCPQACVMPTRMCY